MGVLLLVAALVSGAAAAACGDPKAQNFFRGGETVTDNTLCAYAPVYYCADPLATNYQSGAPRHLAARRRGVPGPPPLAPRPPSKH